MRRCTATLQFLTPYSQSARFVEDELEGETKDAFDERTWRQHCTVNKDGQICVPSQGLKKMLDNAAAKLGDKIPGKRGSTFSKYFKSGVIVEADMPISNGTPCTKENATKIALWCDADGKGGGTRVLRRFPVFHGAKGSATFTLVDDTIPNEIFERTLRYGGLAVGLGRFRPEMGGSNGRFRIESTKWENVKL